MNDSNMTGTGFPNAVPQDSSNRETGKKTTRSAIGAKAQTILDFLRRCTPYEADSIRVMVGHATGKGDTDTIEATDLLAVNRFLNHGLTKENATGNEAVMRHRQERAQKLMSNRTPSLSVMTFPCIRQWTAADGGTVSNPFTHTNKGEG